MAGALQSPLEEQDPQAYSLCSELKVQWPPMRELAQLVHTPRRSLPCITPPQMASVFPGAHVPLLQQPPLQGWVVELHVVVQRCVVVSQAIEAPQSVALVQPQ